jgi:hypothetical protein
MSERAEDQALPELARLQRWMQAVITHPGWVGPGLASAESLRGLDVAPDGVEAVVTASAALSGAGGLAIYCRAYRARLLHCFRAIFPALRDALGEELFDRFALDYLRHHGSRSWTLDRLADAFPQHLADTRPDADAPPDQREPWPDFLIDLAALEHAFLKVYDGPGVEGRPLPAAEAVRELDLHSLWDATPVPAPCLRVFAFRFPVHSYLVAVRRGEAPGLPAARACFVGLTRQDYRIRLYELSPPQYAVLRALDGRHTVSQALARSPAILGEEPPSPATVRGWLADWAAKWFFAAIA